jgi:hypothetical protein
MCDLHLSICFCVTMLIMQIQCGYQILASSRMPMGASNKRRVSNRVRLLLVSLWPHPAIKSAMG